MNYIEGLFVLFNECDNFDQAKEDSYIAKKYNYAWEDGEERFYMIRQKGNKDV